MKHIKNALVVILFVMFSILIFVSHEELEFKKEQIELIEEEYIELNRISDSVLTTNKNTLNEVKIRNDSLRSIIESLN